MDNNRMDEIRGRQTEEEVQAEEKNNLFKRFIQATSGMTNPSINGNICI